jgi:hypothetical protein
MLIVNPKIYRFSINSQIAPSAYALPDNEKTRRGKRRVGLKPRIGHAAREARSPYLCQVRFW